MSHQESVDFIEFVRDNAQQPADGQGKAPLVLPRSTRELYSGIFDDAQNRWEQHGMYTEVEVNEAAIIAEDINADHRPLWVAPVKTIVDQDWQQPRWPMTKEVVSRFTLLADRAIHQEIFDPSDIEPERVLEQVAAEHLVTMGILNQKPKARQTYHPGLYFSADEIAQLRVDFPAHWVPENAFLIGMINLGTRKNLVRGYLDFCAQNPLGKDLKTNDKRYSRYMQSLEQPA